MFLKRKSEDKDSELNDRIHPPSLKYCKFPRECNFDMLLLFQNI